MIDWAFFGLSALLALVGALLTVLAVNPIRGAMALLLSIAGMVGLFLDLHAQFLAAVELIVYAGAVVVLFIFVIMLINVPEDRLPVERATTMRVLGVLAAGFFILESAVLARRYSMPIGPVAEVGTVESVGRALFTDYLLAFEITSVLLLAAVIGAIALAKRKI